MTEARCPRCGHQPVHGTRRTFGTRTIEEFYCPSCELLEVADSDRADYVEVLARWRPAQPTAS
ncbi:MAG TPA: hypothetical protein VFQ53_15500 [Kofleriaceae bacterium]|nr:hypothetical protein [Kofleriaceae bacterium]